MNATMKYLNDTVSAVVISSSLLDALIKIIVAESQWFAVTPRPDDCWEVRVKRENKAHLMRWVKRAALPAEVPLPARRVMLVVTLACDVEEGWTDKELVENTVLFIDGRVSRDNEGHAYRLSDATVWTADGFVADGGKLPNA